MQAPSVRRQVITDVLSAEECAELAFLHNSFAACGYRPHVTSLTLHDLLHVKPELVVPLVRARQKVWLAVETALQMELELYPEFTALIGWRAGASLGWHTDNNRAYLTQRDVSAVLYLNTGGQDFKGGDFMFRQQAEQPAPDIPGATRPAAYVADSNAGFGSNNEGGSDAGPSSNAGLGSTPLSSAGSDGRLCHVERVTPAAGMLVCFLADEEHGVEAVRSGYRLTLTMWFTRNPDACEDRKVIAQLTPMLHNGSSMVAPLACLPDTMYKDQHAAGQDVRVMRLHTLGFTEHMLKVAAILVAVEDSQALSSMSNDQGVGQSFGQETVAALPGDASYGAEHGDVHGDMHGAGHGDVHGDMHGARHGDVHGAGHGDVHGAGHGDVHGAGHGDVHGDMHGAGHGDAHGAGHGYVHMGGGGSAHVTIGYSCQDTANCKALGEGCGVHKQALAHMCAQLLPDSTTMALQHGSTTGNTTSCSASRSVVLGDAARTWVLQAGSLQGALLRAHFAVLCSCLGMGSAQRAEHSPQPQPCTCRSPLPCVAACVMCAQLDHYLSKYTKELLQQGQHWGTLGLLSIDDCCGDT